MKRLINFGSIDQFRTVVSNIQRQANFTGLDEDGKALYDDRKKKPTIEAIGSEKIHGTNAAVCYSILDGFWVQSKKNIITPEMDNVGCAFTAYANKEAWMEIIYTLAEEYTIDLNKNIISVYFEWAGGSIQKNSACSGVDKRSMIFRFFKVSPIDPQVNDKGEETSAKWLETSYSDSMLSNWVSNKYKNIFNIMQFPTVSITIDFNKTSEAQNQMIKLIPIIEKQSPVGLAFGQEKNIGEGYVFTFEYEGNIQRFKIKGEEHSKGSGKVKTLKPIDTELEKKKAKFIKDHACTEGRLNQMFTEVVHLTHNGDETLMSMKDMGQFLRLVVNDVIKEESDIMIEQGLEPKPMNSMISKVSRMFFQDELDRIVGI